MNEIQITLNGESRACPADSSVEALLAELDLTGKPCAVEINRNLVPKNAHPNHLLQEGDTIEIVTLVGGG